MEKDQIHDRLYVLYSVLQFCSQQKKSFTTVERIFINQERGQLLTALDYSQTILKPVSDKIEAKITEALRLTRIYNWKPINKTDFND